VIFQQSVDSLGDPLRVAVGNLGGNLLDFLGELRKLIAVVQQVIGHGQPLARPHLAQAIECSGHGTLDTRPKSLHIGIIRCFDNDARQ